MVMSNLLAVTQCHTNHHMIFVATSTSADFPYRKKPKGGKIFYPIDLDLEVNNSHLHVNKNITTNKLFSGHAVKKD